MSETWILSLIVDEEAENCSVISEPCSCVGRFSHLSVHSTRFIKSIVGAGVLYVPGTQQVKDSVLSVLGF